MALAVALLAFLGGFPLLVLIGKSFQVEGHFSLDNFRAVYTSQANWSAVALTLQVAFLAMVISVALSFPLAWLLGRTDLPLRNLFRTLIVGPYMIPPFVGAIAWTYLANPRTGYLNRLLGESIFNIYSVGGLV